MTEDRMYRQCISNLSEIINNLLPDYLNFRMKEWLEMTDVSGEEVQMQISSDSDSPRSVPETEQANVHVLENLAEQEEKNIDDPDLLLPPSSDEDDSKEA
jgi:hypothetical protein